ncbi:MAG TPA: BTAD domain-containing putative transcriptional regulator [Gaiellales bacterium]|nr:BTAD domain-containing putative transcriptional regulator [Gaiellales bacterium]
MTSDLVRERRFAQAGSMLERFASGCPRDHASAEAARSLSHLCVAAAEHQRLSRELEGAAKRHRIAEQRVGRTIADRLDRWTPHPATAAAPLPPQAARVEARVLGPLAVTIEGVPIERWGSLKARALFEYLLLAWDKPVRRELLMHVFWPRHSRGSARNNLNVSLYNLRRTLADGGPDRHILYADGCYQLNPEISWWIDRTQFLARLPEAQMHLQSGDATTALAAYQAAVALYRGPLFEDDTTSDWHLGEQAHLADLYLDALERLGELHLELHDLTLAERTAKRALADDPCRESAHRLLMRCYAQRQEHHLVSRQLQICATSLRRQFGIDPAPETVEVCESITSRR